MNKRRVVTIKLSVTAARQLRDSIEGWLDAGAPNGKDEGIVGDELKALSETIDQINKGLYS